MFGFCNDFSTSNPLLVEFCAIRTTIQLVLDLIVAHVIIESDSMEANLLVSLVFVFDSSLC